MEYKQNIKLLLKVEDNKEDKAGTQIQILYDLIQMWILKKAKLIYAKRMMVTRGQGESTES